MGAEAEFQVILTENLSLDGSAGYLNAEYDEYSVDLPVYEDYSGNKLNHAPEYMFNIGAQYELALWGGDITTRLDYARRGDTYYAVSYTHLRAHETVLDLVCRLLLDKKKNKKKKTINNKKKKHKSRRLRYHNRVEHNTTITIT